MGRRVARRSYSMGSCMENRNTKERRSDSVNFYCYSIRLYHFLAAFNEHCYSSKVNPSSGNRYWVFKKSDRLDKLISFYNEKKHAF